MQASLSYIHANVEDAAFINKAGAGVSIGYPIFGNVTSTSGVGIQGTTAGSDVLNGFRGVVIASNVANNGEGKIRVKGVVACYINGATTYGDRLIPSASGNYLVKGAATAGDRVGYALCVVTGGTALGTVCLDGRP